MLLDRHILKNGAYQTFSTSILIGVIACMATSSATCRATEKELLKVFHLRQLSSQTGNIDAVISEDFCRYDNSINAISFIVNGKTGDISILSHRKKQYWIEKLEKWAPYTSYVNNILSFNDYHDLLPTGIKPDHSFKMFKLSTQLESFKNPDVYKSSGVSKAERLTVTSAETVTSSALSSNKKLVGAATKLFAIAPSSFYPLTFTFANRKQAVHTPLKTTLVEQTTVKSESFKIPSDYKLAKSERDVYLDSAGHDTLEDMLK